MADYEREFPELFRYIREEKIAVFYNPSRRSFSIGSYDTGMRQEIYYCPWTGKRLPRSLAAKFSDMLREKDLSALEPETWPEEWRSEEWWRKANL
jgi:hypothetical protein